MKYLLFLFAAVLIAAGCSNEGDVVTLDSGLEYMDDSLGTGAKAKEGDLVTIHFAGWKMTDSTNVFEDWVKDSTKEQYLIANSRMYNQPLKFKIGSEDFIKGADEGIVGMKIGGKRTIIIPSNLAYGEQGIGPIPPNTSLKVVIELVDTKEAVDVKQWDADTTKAKINGSGLKYIIIKEGSGKQAASGDVVSVHYSGYLEDGKKFDSSVERDQPFIFTLGKGMVIQGWDEGVALLKEGGKVKLIIPPSLAYGDNDMGPIPANSTLYFDVELIEIK